MFWPITTPTILLEEYISSKLHVSSILRLFVYIEHRRNRNGPVKDDRKITSQMKVHLKLIWLAQRPLNKNRGFLFVKTIKNYLRIPFKCSHILYGIVGYHNNRRTLVANTLNFSYVRVETVLLCRTINRQFNYIGINFAMNKW